MSVSLLLQTACRKSNRIKKRTPPALPSNTGGHPPKREKIKPSANSSAGVKMTLKSAATAMPFSRRAGLNGVIRLSGSNLVWLVILGIGSICLRNRMLVRAAGHRITVSACQTDAYRYLEICRWHRTLLRLVSRWQCRR